MFFLISRLGISFISYHFILEDDESLSLSQHNTILVNFAPKKKIDLAFFH